MLKQLMRRMLEGRESGQTMAEYAVVLCVITVAIVASFQLVNDAVLDALTDVTNVITGAS